jgi:hypothetical protein
MAINSLLVDASISSSQNPSTNKGNDGPLSAIAMLEDLAAEIHESTSLLELNLKNLRIWAKQTMHWLPHTLNDQTGEKAYGYISQMKVRTKYRSK